MFDKLIAVWEVVTGGLDRIGSWLPQLALRLILAWEFWEAGAMKFNGNNWFAGIQDNFPFPLNVIDPGISWFLATWAELIGAVLLVFGLFTRFASFSLIILTIVAALAVHWPDSYGSLGELWKGYAVSDKGFGNFKLPLLFLIMLLPLLFSGAGKASLDHILKKVID